MCRAKDDPQCPGGRRCNGIQGGWHVNREGHLRFKPDPEEERHWMKPGHLLSMTPNAIRQRRFHAKRRAAEVDAIRTIHGVAPGAPIGPVLREELWAHRYQGAGVSLLILADRFRAIAEDEGKTVEEIAERHQQEHVVPHRQSAGERLADLVMERPDWVKPEYLVAAVEPPENGAPSQAYVRVVKDADEAEWVLVTAYDGSEPQAWKHDDAGLKAAMWDCLERVRAINDNPDDYDAWLTENDAITVDSYGPWTQSMTEEDFLNSYEAEGLHLV